MACGLAKQTGKTCPMPCQLRAWRRPARPLLNAREVVAAGLRSAPYASRNEADVSATITLLFRSKRNDFRF